MCVGLSKTAVSRTCGIFGCTFPCLPAGRFGTFFCASKRKYKQVVSRQKAHQITLDEQKKENKEIFIIKSFHALFVSRQKGHMI
jgi:hypothetical protein